MKWLKALFSPGETLNKGINIIDQMVVDKDKANELKANLYLQELKTTTIPIVDAIHKMGRQTLAILQMAFYFYIATKYGADAITPELVAGVSGAASIFTLVKGKGK